LQLVAYIVFFILFVLLFFVLLFFACYIFCVRLSASYIYNCIYLFFPLLNIHCKHIRSYTSSHCRCLIILYFYFLFYCYFQKIFCLVTIIILSSVVLYTLHVQIEIVINNNIVYHYGSPNHQLSMVLFTYFYTNYKFTHICTDTPKTPPMLLHLDIQRIY